AARREKEIAAGEQPAEGKMKVEMADGIAAVKKEAVTVADKAVETLAGTSADGGAASGTLYATPAGPLTRQEAIRRSDKIPMYCSS
ncbi:hypothetical protein HDU96_004549, partial [Phlyctochytrium bullatum]